jgi:hypothetical protein
MRPVNVSAASTTATAMNVACVAMSRWRFSDRSATAPPNQVSSSVGTLFANVTVPSISGDLVRS